MKRKVRRYAADFETTVYKGQERTDVWSSAFSELFSETEEVTIHHTIKETYDYFSNMKEDVIAYYHNLKFDGAFWLDFLMNEMGYTTALSEVQCGEKKAEKWIDNKNMKPKTLKCSISSMGQWYTITIKTNKNVIELRDSLKLLPFTLARIGKSFKLKHQKLEMEYDGFRFPGCDITDEEKAYIANDVLVLREALEFMFSEGHDKLTIGACCLSEFVNGFGKEDYDSIFPDIYKIPIDESYGSPNAGEYVRKSYRGGWCYVVKAKRNEIKTNGTTADVNSLYPSMMSSESGNRFPVGRPTFYSMKNSSDEMKKWWLNRILWCANTMQQYYFVRFKTRFYLKHDKLPFIQIKNSFRFCGTDSLETSDKRMLEITGDIAANIIEPNSEDVDLEGPHLVDGRMVYASKTFENLDATRKAGLWGVSMPRRYGGLNMPITPYSMASEIVSAADAGFQNIWSLQDCIETLYEFGDEEQRKKYIPRVCAGETMSMDLTEPDAGSDLQRVMLKASYDEENKCWRLNGVKRFITNGDSDIHLVLARSEEGTHDGRGLSMFIYDKRDGGVTVRHIEHKLGIHGSPTCELVYKNAKCELCGSTRLGLIKYVMALMNGARLGIAAQSVGVSQAAYNEGLAYAKERKQFDTAIIDFPAVYDMLSRMKAKLDAGRAILYQTARYVDIYKALDDIARERKLTPEERAEQKKYTRLADAFTPLAKGMNSEYANQNAYDAIQIHGGSGFIMEYKSQRLYRDARIFSIYEGTTQLQVVAAIRYITNGTYLSIMKEMMERPICECAQPMRERIAKLITMYEDAINYVKEQNDQALQDFLARRLYEMTADIIMSILLLEDATRAPELFKKSINVFMRHAEAECTAHHAYIKAMKAEDLENFKATL